MEKNFHGDNEPHGTFDFAFFGNPQLPVFLSAATAVANSSIVTLCSNQVGEERQGWVMGITGSIMAATWGMSGIIIGIFAAWDATLPIIIAACGLFLTFLFFTVSTIKIKRFFPEDQNELL